VPDGESVLFVTHGGALEIALVTALPEADHGSWGPTFAHCEGARLLLAGGTFHLDTILRVPRRAG
jgi:hypothetical protein